MVTESDSLRIKTDVAKGQCPNVIAAHNMRGTPGLPWLCFVSDATIEVVLVIIQPDERVGAYFHPIM
jgi:hypothetical protein